jgi:hypothetical protein
MIEYIYTVYDSSGKVLASGVAPNMTTLSGEEVFWRRSGAGSRSCGLPLA